MTKAHATGRLRWHLDASYAASPCGYSVLFTQIWKANCHFFRELVALGQNEKDELGLASHVLKLDYYGVHKGGCILSMLAMTSSGNATTENKRRVLQALRPLGRSFFLRKHARYLHDEAEVSASHYLRRGKEKTYLEALFNFKFK